MVEATQDGKQYPHAKKEDMQGVESVRKWLRKDVSMQTDIFETLKCKKSIPSILLLCTRGFFN